jgi:hypothetical protein
MSQATITTRSTKLTNSLAWCFLVIVVVIKGYGAGTILYTSPS